MAGMDWLRWHHGSVTDPKFQLVAKKSGASVAEVVALWAFALEEASLADDRGSIAGLDVESVECLLGLDDGIGTLILAAMEVRGLIAAGRIASWDKRQPKREREDDNAAERKRLQRQKEAEGANKNHVTPSHAESHQEKPRVEESREESTNPLSESIVDGAPEMVDENPPKNETRTGGLCKQLRVIGIDAAPHYQAWPELLSGFSNTEIIGAAQKARDSKPGERIHLNYILPILKDRCPPTARGSPKRSTSRQSRVDSYAAEAAAARGEDEIKHSTGRTERDITGESVRVA